jgi:drug/metabolite transporter (DMT)-like permease
MVQGARDKTLLSFLLAIALVLSANVLFPLQDALTKQMIADFPVWAVLFVRSVAVLAATLAIGSGRLIQHIVVTPWRAFLTIRAAVMLCGGMTFYLSVRSLGLGQAVTLYFLSPILVAIAARPFLESKPHGCSGRRSCSDSSAWPWRAEFPDSGFRRQLLSR